MGGPLEAKVVLLGSQGTGKTSLVVRFIQGTFETSVPSTIGASFFTHKMTYENCRVKLQIWDTAGQERFRSMAPMYYRGSHAALILFDVTRPETFDEVDAWVKDVEKHTNNAAISILANKIDKPEALQDLVKRGKAYADSIGAEFFKTSALTAEGINEVFLSTVKRLIAQRGDDEPQSEDKAQTVALDDAAEQTEKKPCCS